MEKKLDMFAHHRIYDVKCWWYYDKNNLLHRGRDLPALDCENGTQKWYNHGEKHRDNGLPAVIWDEGTLEWWVGNKFIKEDSSNRRRRY